ncbi:hypothetical protein ABT160_34595 [Streptomyces sp. NPDC001941]|uniref:hypothetical protein n=1 Tax=Streptomyces sp. NPDC001941 TaxID=3154659 RepID=UPI003328CA1E
MSVSRPAGALGVLLLTLATACADPAPGPPADNAARTTARARAVADAWHGSPALKAWREGFFPTGALERLPDDAFHDGADKSAHLEGRYDLAVGGALPTARPAGTVRWADGSTAVVATTTAREAYERLTAARGGGGGGGKESGLTVTKVAAGTMDLHSSRGEVTVPSWEFTLKGYATPLRYAAVRPTTLPEPPIASLGNDTSASEPVHSVRAVSADGLSVTVTAVHGACDLGAAVAVLETDESVVLTGTVKEAPVDDSVDCAAVLNQSPVTVKLRRPLGTRALLDAHSGDGITGQGREPR